MIKLSQKHLQTIRTHAESTYPDECCGLILGYVANDSKTVVQVRPTENAWMQKRRLSLEGNAQQQVKNGNMRCLRRARPTHPKLC